MLNRRGRQQANHRQTIPIRQRRPLVPSQTRSNSPNNHYGAAASPSPSCRSRIAPWKLRPPPQTIHSVGRSPRWRIKTSYLVAAESSAGIELWRLRLSPCYGTSAISISVRQRPPRCRRGLESGETPPDRATRHPIPKPRSWHSRPPSCGRELSSIARCESCNHGPLKRSLLALHLVAEASARPPD